MPDAAPAPAPAPATPPAPTVLEVLDIDQVWAGHPVGFALHTVGERQFVAYYAADRRMTVAARTLGSADWQRVTLPHGEPGESPTTLVWDSHNYVTFAFDADGHMHLSGNMHCVPLVYFRTERPYDITSLRRIPAMTGAREGKCTYPIFMHDRAGDLIYRYRDGGSGNGVDYYNRYDHVSRTWSRLLDTPLLDGVGLMNAYSTQPTLGPDGWFHMLWVWRDTPNAATNHDLSYARSRDLRHWESIDGPPLALPMTLANTDAAIVDPTPAGGGMLNGMTHLGFDADQQVLVSYMKYDAAGKSQLYTARYEAAAGSAAWVHRCFTSWDYRWDFGGNGSLNNEIRLSAPRTLPDGSLGIAWRHSQYGTGGHRLDGRTLAPIGPWTPPQSLPADFAAPRHPAPGIEVRQVGDRGTAPNPAERYILRWETLPQNRDKPQDPIPAPSTLQLLRLARTGAAACSIRAW